MKRPHSPRFFLGRCFLGRCFLGRRFLGRRFLGRRFLGRCFLGRRFLGRRSSFSRSSFSRHPNFLEYFNQGFEVAHSLQRQLHVYSKATSHERHAHATSS